MTPVTPPTNHIQRKLGLFSKARTGLFSSTVLGLMATIAPMNNVKNNKAVSLIVRDITVSFVLTNLYTANNC